ncbi:MAG: hypothetical protein GX657_08080 [Chloroflexi bacterium]|nr:hypothetical protein [Chloroflexota bacterium]
MAGRGPQEGKPPRARVWLNWLLIYTCWAGASALAVATVFALRRAAVLAHTALRLNRWALSLTDRWTLFGLSLVALGWILYTQYYLVDGYPGGAGLGTFPRRLVRVVLIELAVLAPALLLRLVL